MRSRDDKGNYYIQYVLKTPPSGCDLNVWTATVTEYLQRQGVEVEQTTPATTMVNTDWPELRRLYNRLLGEGKQRRNAESHAAPDAPFKTEESEDV